MTDVRPELPPMPARIAALRRHRGYPVPYFVADVNGVPDFRIMDPRKLLACIREELCWVCGEPLAGYVASVVGPMCAVNRVSAEPPTHPGCAVWSARACPFLARPHARRRDVGQPVAEPAGVMIRRNPGVALVWIARSITAEGQRQGGYLFRLHDPTRVRWFAEGRDATRAEVLESIETGLPLLLEAAAGDGPDAITALGEQLDRALELVPGGEQLLDPQVAASLVAASLGARFDELVLGRGPQGET